MSKPISVLFVCTGNICRSPTAEGVARVLAQRAGVGERFRFASAGIEGYHVGDPPDPRTIAAARKRGYDLSAQRARRLTATDFSNFDHVLAMDAGHLMVMRQRCPEEFQGKLALFLDYSESHPGQDVPDPYYGDSAGFNHVLDLVEHAANRLVNQLSMI
jgi:protein-tyrosine phosphatase